MQASPPPGLVDALPPTAPAGARVVRSATLEDVPHLAGVLARAFSADPLINWLTREDAVESPRREAFFEVCLRRLSHELSDTFTTADLAGAALWKAPGQYRVPLAQQAQLVPTFAKIAGWGHLPAIVRLLHVMEKHHEALVPGPHFYLFALGVEPELQRRGLGGALMRPVLARCDREGLPAFLETAREDNVPYYERYGFRVEHVIERAGWPKLWMMVRPKGG